MARDGKRFELRPVDDEVEKPVSVIRLENDEISRREKSVRLAASPVESHVSQRLDVPSRENFETRTHQPGIEALIETTGPNPDEMEQAWGAESKNHRQIPWGWFVLIALILAGSVIWSLSSVKTADVHAEKVRVASETVLIDDAKEEREAGQLIDRIEQAIQKYFRTDSIERLVPMVRQPERVRPLMESYYSERPIPTATVKKVRTLQPVTIENRADFWMASVELENQGTRNLLMEIEKSGNVLIDWETLVCYQPIKWDTFALERPSNTSYDFRVYLEEDNFFSHEFADSSRWNCYRLTTLDSEETVFGYCSKDGDIANALGQLLKSNGNRRTSVILRLGIPERLQSRSGVMIEKLMCPRWLYVNPPNNGS